MSAKYKHSVKCLRFQRTEAVTGAPRWTIGFQKLATGPLSEWVGCFHVKFGDQMVQNPQQDAKVNAGI